RDAACTARWCIGAAQRSVGNERPARSASLRHGAVNIQLLVAAPLTPFGLPLLAALDAQLRQEAIWCLLREGLCSPDEPRPAERWTPDRTSPKRDRRHFAYNRKLLGWPALRTHGALHTHNNTQLRGRNRHARPEQNYSPSRAANGRRGRKRSRRCSHASSGSRRSSTRSSPWTSRSRNWHPAARWDPPRGRSGGRRAAISCAPISTTTGAGNTRRARA